MVGIQVDVPEASVFPGGAPFSYREGMEPIILPHQVGYNTWEICAANDGQGMGGCYVVLQDG